MSKHGGAIEWGGDAVKGARSLQLAHEAPLHITVNGEAYVTTMRTADGHDASLARGLLFTEGIVVGETVAFECVETLDPETQHLALLDVRVDPEHMAIPIAGRRSQISSSSCGICGTRDPADLELYGDPIRVGVGQRISPNSLLGMMEEMAHAQSAFRVSGGTHGAGAFGLDATVLVVREDIGRHNAVDKVLGNLLEQGRLAEVAVLTVSGRVSYEIVSKVYRSQIPILAAVSAPTSMAVETAEAFGITLLGFCREGRLTVYTHPGRIALEEEIR